jgi:diketogulonate reductase-like aldo/keto reductase
VIHARRREKRPHRPSHRLGVALDEKARRPSHIEDSIAAVDLTLSEGDLERMDQITANAAPISGPSPEMMPE